MTLHRVTRDLLASSQELLGEGPWSMDDLLAQGWTPRRLQSAVRRGALARVRRGVYTLPVKVPATPDGGTDEPITAQWIRASLGRLAGAATASHESAAILHGTWVPGPSSRLVHVTLPGQPDRWSPGLRVHSSRLPEEFVTTVRGIRTTTLARTAVDLARGRTLPFACVAIDGAYRRMLGAMRHGAGWELRARAVPAAAHRQVRAELEAAFGVTWSWPGTRVVRQAIDRAEPACESPFESWSRGWMLLAALPDPVVNMTVRGASGRTYVGDFVWLPQRLIGEADGLGKYGTDEAHVRATLREERVRQADLEEAGWRFVRWTTGEPGAQIVSRIARYLFLT
jgi:hypothetical protein